MYETNCAIAFLQHFRTPLSFVVYVCTGCSILLGHYGWLHSAEMRCRFAQGVLSCRLSAHTQRFACLHLAQSALTITILSECSRHHEKYRNANGFHLVSSSTLRNTGQTISGLNLIFPSMYAEESG